MGPFRHRSLKVKGLLISLPLIALVLLPHPHEAEDSQIVFVSRVVDGDTVILSTGESVRYIGIDAPELNRPDGRPGLFALEATYFNRGLVEGKWVTLRFDVERRDAYGRLLAYAFVGKRFVNADLVRYGYARAYPFPPNLRYHSLFCRLEDAALRKRFGIWRRGGYDRLRER